MTEQALAAMEARSLFLQRRALRFIPLLAAGCIAEAWLHPVASPLVAVVVVVLCGLEPQFMNIFYRSPRELELLSILPVDWRKVVLIKNLSTIAAALVLLPVVSAFLLYFSPSTPSGNDWLELMQYLSTIIFPLICVGNRYSVESPRRYAGMAVDDILQAVLMFVYVALCSIPFLIIRATLGAAGWQILYAGVTAVFWARVSVPVTAELLSRRGVGIWQRA